MDKFVGPMAVAHFFKEFVPEAPSTRPKDTHVFSEDIALHREEFIDAIHDSGVCPKLLLKDTTKGVGTNGRIMNPGISVFSRSRLGAGDDWRATEFWIENKRLEEDFIILRADDPLEAEEDFPGHVKYHEGFRPLYSRMFDFASTLHRLQFRIFSFSIALFGDTGRLFRWDRSGVVYTQPFEWKKQPETLFEFFWRFNHLSPAERGHDPTVLPATADEINRALPKL
ncbi:hypothetical protein BC834DRAFT_205318 [Gloeopeniophorella convolvens]|nr:hypothetical protein BC834DRAFT_205318 [Gloeopeniophorella convolvens]